MADPRDCFPLPPFPPGERDPATLSADDLSSEIAAVWLSLDAMCTGRRILAWHDSYRLARAPQLYNTLRRYRDDACRELLAFVADGCEVTA